MHDRCSLQVSRLACNSAHTAAAASAIAIPWEMLIGQAAACTKANRILAYF